MPVQHGSPNEPNRRYRIPDFPTGARYDFRAALTPLAGGAYYVRGGAHDADDAVMAFVSTSPNGNVSAVAPLFGPDWSVDAPGRVLLYGAPIDENYDWMTIRPLATFPLLLAP